MHPVPLPEVMPQPLQVLLPPRSLLSVLERGKEGRGGEGRDDGRGGEGKVGPVVCICCLG